MVDFNKYIPKVSKKDLFLVSFIAWLGTSIYLIISGISNVISDHEAIGTRLGIAIPVGLILYFLIFRKLIYRYLDHIFSIGKEKASIFKFMSLKGYAFLLTMSAIIFSIEIYKIIALDYVLTFQSVMSIPVFLCSLSFFKAWKVFK